MREYPGRGYAQESMTYIQWYIGTCNYCIIASKFATAMDLYLCDCCGIVLCDCCGIVTFAVELYLRFAMELLVIFRASFQEDSPLEYPVFASTI